MTWQELKKLLKPNSTIDSRVVHAHQVGSVLDICTMASCMLSIQPECSCMDLWFLFFFIMSSNFTAIFTFFFFHSYWSAKSYWFLLKIGAISSRAPHHPAPWSARRETTKNKYVQPISPRLLDYPRRWDGIMYFRSEVVLGLPVSTTSYSRHAVSTFQTWSAGPTTVRSLINTDGATLFSARSQLLFFLSF